MILRQQLPNCFPFFYDSFLPRLVAKCSKKFVKKFPRQESDFSLLSRTLSLLLWVRQWGHLLLYRYTKSSSHSISNQASFLWMGKKFVVKSFIHKSFCCWCYFCCYYEEFLEILLNEKKRSDFLSVFFPFLLLTIFLSLLGLTIHHLIRSPHRVCVCVC